MNAERLIAHYETIAEAPGAIARLRRFVLDLAVRGKLVPQDPNDEPASELLKRIAAEKARAIANCKENQPPSLDDLSFAIPPRWQPAKIEHVLDELQTGPFGSSLHESDYRLGGTPVINPASLQNEQIVPVEKMAVDAPTLERLASFKLRAGDIVMARRGEMGRCAVVGDREAGWLCGTGSLILRPSKLIYPRFLVALIGSPFGREYLGGSAVGATMQNLNQSILLNLPFGLPPFAEQHRIVAKVDELMDLCDRLEAARMAREATRDRLAAASLARLNAPDPEAFQADARFALNALPTLTTRADQIKALRQTILNLAVRGKLVPQDPNESPENQTTLRPDNEAEEYDRRAFEERSVLFEFPTNWRIEPLSRVSHHIVDCPHTTPNWTATGVLCIKTNQVRAGVLDLTSPYFVSEDTYKIRVERLEPRCDDILYIREGGVRGVGCRIPPNTRLCLGQRLMLIRANGSVTPAFLELCINSSWITQIAEEKTTGGAAPRVNMSVVRAYPIPIPPLAEQHRIVAKVDELMALCDWLEASLATADGTRRRLLDALLAEALAPAEDRVLEAAE